MDERLSRKPMPPIAGRPPPADFYEPTSYNPSDSVGYLMRRIMSLVALAVERELESTGLTHAQWIPLFKLAVHPGGATVAELARLCELDAGAMTRLLDRLEAKGLCQRERSSEDRRVVNLALTEAGREAAKEIPVVLSRVHNAFLDGFSHEEWQNLKGYLRRMLDNANKLQQQNQLLDENKNGS